jgi:hypothetical protein
MKKHVLKFIATYDDCAIGFYKKKNKKKKKCTKKKTCDVYDKRLFQQHNQESLLYEK